MIIFTISNSKTERTPAIVLQCNMMMKTRSKPWPPQPISTAHSWPHQLPTLPARNLQLTPLWMKVDEMLSGDWSGDDIPTIVAKNNNTHVHTYLRTRMINTHNLSLALPSTPRRDDTLTNNFMVHCHTCLPPPIGTTITHHQQTYSFLKQPHAYPPNQLHHHVLTQPITRAQCIWRGRWWQLLKWLGETTQQTRQPAWTRTHTRTHNRYIALIRIWSMKRLANCALVGRPTQYNTLIDTWHRSRSRLAPMHLSSLSHHPTRPLFPLPHHADPRAQSAHNRTYRVAPGARFQATSMLLFAVFICFSSNTLTSPHPTPTSLYARALVALLCRSEGIRRKPQMERPWWTNISSKRESYGRSSKSIVMGDALCVITLVESLWSKKMNGCSSGGPKQTKRTKFEKNDASLGC